MSLFYNKINLSINGSNILADSISISDSSESRPGYILGNSLPFDTLPQGIKGNVNITYFVETNNEPNYSIITGWKNNTTGLTTALINIGGTIITGYLNTYSFSLLNNQSVKAQATYQIFSPITGNYQSSSSSDANLYNSLNGSGVAHYWTSSFYSANSLVSDNQILQVDYTFNANIIPIYSLGRPLPSQIAIVSANETLNTINEVQNNLIFRKSGINNVLTGVDGLRLRNIATLYSTGSELFFSLTGMNAQTNKLDVNINNITLFNHTFNKDL